MLRLLASSSLIVFVNIWNSLHLKNKICKHLNFFIFERQNLHTFEILCIWKTKLAENEVHTSQTGKPNWLNSIQNLDRSVAQRSSFLILTNQPFDTRKWWTNHWPITKSSDYGSDKVLSMVFNLFPSWKDHSPSFTGKVCIFQNPRYVSV